MTITFRRIALVCLALVVGSTALINPGPNIRQIKSSFRQMQKDVQEILQFKNSMVDTLSSLARQVQQQQLFVEERVRSDGSSGVKQVRGNGAGTRPYHTATTAAEGVNSIHDHANYDRTVGMGEFIGVLNGVEFRTRHNDYKLVMPSTKSNNFDETEPIPFPNIPRSVTAKNSVKEQITEMQQYFKAFKHQDPTIRNYRPFFKPVLCYLEGGWTTDTSKLSEPFESDRHFIDADSWFDLQQKIMFMSSTGGKSQFENYSYLPTTIINVTADGTPVYAQWNYRILCHPIQEELSLKDLTLVDDLAARMRTDKTFKNYGDSKAARFSVAPAISYGYDAELGFGKHNDKRYKHGRLDEIMYEIPGKENYKGSIHDDDFGLSKYTIRGGKNSSMLNTARYHRNYRVQRKGAMGLNLRTRGFSDPNLFVAKTTNPKIARFSTNSCKKKGKVQNCEFLEASHTYAIPLEIIWLTPLHKWNPYNLTFFGKDNKRPTINGRKGGFERNTAFKGTSSDKYYITPSAFYNGGGETNPDPADTVKDSAGVLDPTGTVRYMSGSGVRIFTPEIPGVGVVRLRYPIMPLHQEGNAIHKNLMALQDITMDMKRFTDMFETRPELTPKGTTPTDRPKYEYRTSTTHLDPPGAHYHDIPITHQQLTLLEKPGTNVTVYTSVATGHSHELVLTKDTKSPIKRRLLILSCDGNTRCWDKHFRYAVNKFRRPQRKSG